MALRLYDITTGTGDFIANGVVSHNCFARPTHEYLDFDAGRDFEQRDRRQGQRARGAAGGAGAAVVEGRARRAGTNTDPYQWVEGRYGLMRGIWEALRDARNPCSVLTKSPLLLRDLDLLLRDRWRSTEFSACLSIPTLDEKAWRATEPHTPHPRKRLEAVAELNAAGIPTGVLIAPLMPGINDAPEQVERDRASWRRRPARRASAARRCSCAATIEGRLHGLAARAPAGPVPRYEQLYAPRRVPAGGASAARSSAPPARRAADRRPPSASGTA